MEVDTGSVSVPEFHWNLKLLLRFGYPEGIHLHLLPSTYRQYFDKIISTNSILAGSVFWEEVFEGILALNVTFIISTGINDFVPVVKIRAAGNEADHGELADVLTLANYPNYVVLLAKRTGGTRRSTASSSTRTEDGQCHIQVPTTAVPVMGSIRINDVRSLKIGSSTAAQIAPEGNRKRKKSLDSLDSPTQRLYPDGTTRGRSPLSTSNGEISSFSTRTPTPTKRGRRVKIQNKQKGSLTDETDSDSESDSTSKSKSEVVPNTQPPVTTVMVQTLQPSTVAVIPVEMGTAQIVEIIAPRVRSASEQEHSAPERIPIIAKVESACEHRLHTPTPQTIQDFIDLTQDSDDEDENEANHCSPIPVNADNSTSTPERSSNIHGPSVSDNVAFTTPSHAESVAATNCVNIVHAVAQPVLPVEFVHVKQELLDNVAEQSPIPLIAAVENVVVNCRLNVEPNQNNGDHQDELVMSVPSMVVKVETNQNENDLETGAVAVPTTRDDHSQVGLQLNIRGTQPPMFTELLIESRPIKEEDEDMSAAGNPLGNTMGGETQETASLPQPYSAVVNSGTSFDPSTAVNTVKNSARKDPDEDNDEDIWIVDEFNYSDGKEVDVSQTDLAESDSLTSVASENVPISAIVSEENEAPNEPSASGTVVPKEKKAKKSVGARVIDLTSLGKRKRETKPTKSDINVGVENDGLPDDQPLVPDEQIPGPSTRRRPDKPGRSTKKKPTKGRPKKGDDDSDQDIPYNILNARTITFLERRKAARKVKHDPRNIFSAEQVPFGLYTWRDTNMFNKAKYDGLTDEQKEVIKSSVVHRYYPTFTAFQELNDRLGHAYGFEDTKFRCTLCSHLGERIKGTNPFHKFKTRQSFDDHYTSKHMTPVFCPYCGDHVGSHKYLQGHLMKMYAKKSDTNHKAYRVQLDIEEWARKDKKIKEDRAAKAAKKGKIVFAKKKKVVPRERDAKKKKLSNPEDNGTTTRTTRSGTVTVAANVEYQDISDSERSDEGSFNGSEDFPEQSNAPKKPKNQ